MSAFSSLLDAFEARSAEHALRRGPYVEGAAFVRGEYVPADEAMVPLFDLGFLRSDLTYDVPAVWGGRFFRLDDHLARLERSCAKLRITPPLSTPQIREMLIELVRRTQLRDAYVDVIVTRGQAAKGQRDPRLAQSAIYAFVVPYIWILPLAAHETGGSAIVTRDVRRTPPGAMDPTIKNLQWGDLTRGFFEAFDRHANLPLLPDGDGNITEGCYNVFAVHGRELRTPGRGVLEGRDPADGDGDRPVRGLGHADGGPAGQRPLRRRRDLPQLDRRRHHADHHPRRQTGRRRPGRAGHPAQSGSATGPCTPIRA